MMWFTADLHLGDTNILHDMDRPFDSVEEMNRKVIDAINECVAADDRLYILGVFTYRLPMAEAVRLREEEGLTAEDIAAVLEQFKKRGRSVAVGDSLKHLQKGGRLPAAVAIVGGALGI